MRHNDFIPWDDDLDVGILRSDYLRFIEVIQDEIDKSGIKDVVAVFKISVQDRMSPRFFQIEFRRPEFRGKFIGIDLFPYDFADNVDNIEEKFYESKAKFYKRRIDGMDIAEAVDMVYSELDLSFEKQEYLVPGVEGVRGKGEFYKLKVMKTDEIFPFKKVEFWWKNL